MAAAVGTPLFPKPNLSGAALFLAENLAKRTRLRTGTLVDGRAEPQALLRQRAPDSTSRKARRTDWAKDCIAASRSLGDGRHELGAHRPGKWAAPKRPPRGSLRHSQWTGGCLLAASRRWQGVRIDAAVQRVGTRCPAFYVPVCWMRTWRKMRSGSELEGSRTMTVSLPWASTGLTSSMRPTLLQLPSVVLCSLM